MIVLESNQNHAKVEDTEICPILTASMGLGGGYIPMIVVETSNIIAVNETLIVEDQLCGPEEISQKPLTEVITKVAEVGGGAKEK